MTNTDLRPGSIRILTTGGTIDKVYFDALSQYKVGNPQIVEILADVNVRLEYSVTSLFMKDSLDLTSADREVIKNHVENASEDRILITHGTDTMVQTANVLAPVDSKTVVFVGSLSPSRFKGSDAEFNVGFALAAVQLLPAGIFIAMNGQVFRHDEVQKNREENRFEMNT